MAAAFIPLIASVAPEIISLIAGLVHKQAPVIEAANGPNTGPIKFGQLTTFIKGVIQQAIDAKALPAGSMPGDADLNAIVQSAVSILKLPGGSLATPTATTATTIPSTVTLTITGGTLQVTQS